MRYEKMPNFSQLRIWECDDYMKHAQSAKYKFVRYPNKTLGYHFYNSEEQICLFPNMLFF